MVNRPPPIALSLLLEAFTLPRSVYVLGAGASAPTTLMMQQLPSQIIDRFWKFGAFPAHPLSLPLDINASRIMNIPGDRLDYRSEELRIKRQLDSLSEEIQFEQELASRISSEAVKAITIRLLSPEPPTFCPQYQVFQLAQEPSIFNLNVDGLAWRFYRGVLDLHGTVPDRELLSSLGWNALEDSLLEFPDLRGPSIPGLVYPGPEDLTITQRPTYRGAEQLLFCAHYVVLIGYSFGRMDDVATYKFLCTHLRRTPKPVIVVDLDPWDLMLRIQDEVKSTKVYGFRAHWNVLAQAIIETTRVRHHKSCSMSRPCPTCVSYSYQRLLDRLG